MVGPDEPLVDYLFRHGYPSSHLNQVLTLHNICTVSDAFNRHTSRWLPAIKHLLQAVRPAAPLPDLPDSLSPTSIRIGQLWHTHAPCLEEPSFRAAAPNGIVLEIRGWLDPHTIAVQLWTGSSSSHPITTARTLFLATPSQGAASTHSITFADAFGPSAAPFTQFITGPDRKSHLRRLPTIAAEVIAITPHSTVLPHATLVDPPSPLPHSLINLINSAPQQLVHAYLT